MNVGRRYTDGVEVSVASTLLLPLSIALFAVPTSASSVQVSVHIANADDVPVVSTDWVEARLARATELFAGASLEFHRIDSPAVDVAPPGGQVINVADRHALAAHAPIDGSVHVFVVDRLADKDRAGNFISGVHWRYVGRKRRWRGRRYIILSKASRVSTLAHELGHFFGLPHTPVKNTLMTSPKRLAGAALNASQLRVITTRYKRYLRSKRLK